MNGTGAQRKDWAELYETFFANAERLTEEIDRLSDDVKNTRASAAVSQALLKEAKQLATQLAAQAEKIATSWENAEEIATAAGNSAAESLTSNARQTSDALCKRLNTAATAVEQTTTRLRRVSTDTRLWCVACVVSAVISMGLGALGMHWIQQRDAATQQDVYLRMQGVILYRMAANATKKEHVVFDALYRREQNKIATEAARAAQN